MGGRRRSATAHRPEQFTAASRLFASTSSSASNGYRIHPPAPVWRLRSPQIHPPQVRTLEICLCHIKQHIRIRRPKLGQRLLPLFDRFQNFAARHDELPFTMCRPVGGDSEPTQSCRQAVVGQTMLEGHAHTRSNTNVPLLAPPKPLTPEMRRNVNGSAVNRVPFSNWIVNLLPEINPLISRPD